MQPVFWYIEYIRAGAGQNVPGLTSVETENKRHRMENMMYTTVNECEHFDFTTAQVESMRKQGETLVIELASVTILPENSCNRDIRKMGAPFLALSFSDSRISDLVKEGVKVYDADGNLTQTIPDETLEFGEFATQIQGACVYELTKSANVYRVGLETEDCTYLLKLCASGTRQDWERFMNLDNSY